ncbi:hypothetical protein BB560_006268 [Smittium megazygosporum]|uniref:2-dehydropantoate 2-reductase n=1 Tax=Smittium megazygosporum TaxID=133381 RepID=A0A2T9YBY0_9FUNG|nr:hypothetical protein BB560_006268 [Smittium megazygosporum]
MTKASKYLIFGGGAVGSVFAWRLQKGGANVSVICRSNYEAVRDNGFKINSVKHGPGVFIPDNVYSTASEAVSNNQVYDFILVCSKSLPNIVNPAELVAPSVLNKKTVLVLMQNGIGIEQYFEEKFPQNPIVPVTVYVDSFQTELGHISHGNTSKLEYGIYKSEHADNEYNKLILEQFEHDLLAGDVESVILKNLQRARWSKVIWNATFGPVSVVAGKYNARELIRDPLANQLVRNAMKELIELSDVVTGEKTTELPPDEYISGIMHFTDNRKNAVVPSMLVDFQNKRPMEHQVIVKNPIDVANKLGIKVPVMETLYALLVLLEKKSLGSDKE